ERLLISTAQPLAPCAAAPFLQIGGRKVMAEIKAEMVQKLREKTQAGMMACKKALTEAGGDFEKAIELLRKAGEAKFEKSQSRVAAEGAFRAFHTVGGEIAWLD